MFWRVDFPWRSLKSRPAAAGGAGAGKAPKNCGKTRASGLARPPSAIVAAMSRRIAIVEDEPAIRANYAEALRKHGFEVAAYAARGEALAAMRTPQPAQAQNDIA